MSDPYDSKCPDILVIGSSAGGVEALSVLARGLPEDLRAAVLVVQHLAPHGISVLPRILDRAGPLPACHPEDGEPLRHGRIYIAPPDRHLLVEPGHVRVTLGPQENRHRPAVDALFRTAAHAYGGRVVGVVLTGSGDDGTAGLGEIKRRGGLAVVQEPAEAFSPGMPQSALEFVPVDYRLPLKEIAPLLSRLARGEAVPADPSPVLRPEKGAPLMREAADGRSSPLREVLADPQEPTVPGPRDGFSCPQCNGHLWDMEEGGFLRFRCRVGHTFTVESLLAGKQENLEFTLWAAVNTFQESAALSRRMVDRLQRAGHHLAARRLLRRAEEAEGHARLLRELLGSGAFVSPLTADLEEFGDADLERAV